MYKLLKLLQRSITEEQPFNSGALEVDRNLLVVAAAAEADDHPFTEDFMVNHIADIYADSRFGWWGFGCRFRPDNIFQLLFIAVKLGNRSEVIVTVATVAEEDAGNQFLRYIGDES